MLRGLLEETPRVRSTAVLGMLEIASSSWYRKSVPAELRRRPGPRPKRIHDNIREAVVHMANENPWYGYKRIAVMCRRELVPVKDREAYLVMREHGLLQQRRTHEVELYQAAKLFELLPDKPNDLWQMDVTYIHIPTHGWWYAVTVLDYYSRYLLGCHLTSSYSAHEVIAGLRLARQEAERIHGTLTRMPFLVTDNGSSFLARRFQDHLQDQFRHVRIRYRTPTQLGLLERFHRTLKQEEVYWQLYDDPQHARSCLATFRDRYNQRRPHWALIPEAGGDPLVPLEVYRGDCVTQIPKWQTWARHAQAKLQELIHAA